LSERIYFAFVTVPFQKEAWPWCQFLSLNFSFSTQARPLISIAIDRGVLLEPACKIVMTYDKRFQFGKSFSERIHSISDLSQLGRTGTNAIPIWILSLKLLPN
jgi:hypothetical protein